MVALIPPPRPVVRLTEIRHVIYPPLPMPVHVGRFLSAPLTRPGGVQWSRRGSIQASAPSEAPLLPRSGPSPGIRHCCPSSRTGHTLARMELLPSAHVDTFCRDHLPPADQWPDLSFDPPELV